MHGVAREFAQLQKMAILASLLTCLCVMPCLGQTPPDQLIVEPTNQLPVSVTEGRFVIADGRAIVDALLSVPVAPGKFKSAVVSLMQIRDGKVKGGQGFTVTLASSAIKKNYQLVPFFAMLPGDRIAAYVSEVDSATKHVTPNKSDLELQIHSLLLQANTSAGFVDTPFMRPHIVLASLNVGRLPKAQRFMQDTATVQPDVIDCSQAVAQAQQVSTGGVASFSCSTTGYSFTCK